MSRLVAAGVAALLALAAPAAGGPAKGRGTVIVCKGTTAVPVGAVRKTTIQAGLDAANAMAAGDVTIRICAGEYREDLSIQSSKRRLRLVGSGKVTLRGTGAAPTLIRLGSDCPDRPCFPRTLIQGLTLAGPGTGKPQSAIWVTNDPCSYAEQFCAERYRAELSFLDGEIEDFNAALAAEGLVGLVIERTTVRNARGGAIGLMAGGSPPVTGEDDCALSSSPRVLVLDSRFLGGGLFVDANNASVTIYNSTVRGYETALPGGVLWLRCARLTIKRSVLTGNRGTAIISSRRSTVLLQDTHLVGNVSTREGVILAGGHVDLVGGALRGNRAPKGLAVVWVPDETSELSSRGTCFSGNKPADIRTPAGAQNVGCNPFHYP